MAPNKDNEEGITLSNENTLAFCDVCINYITKNGRGQQMRWRDIEELFTERVGKRCNFKSLKNKYDSMKKDWRLWKFLKLGETGLGWNSTTGKLECSNEWWEKKLKEKPDAKKYRNKGVWPPLEEKWDQLFCDVVATGAGCVAPSLNPDTVDKTSNGVDEIQNTDGWCDEAYHEYSQYSRLEILENEENSFWQDFSKEVTGVPANSVPVPAANSVPVPANCDVPKGNNKSVKRRKRESGGSVLMKEHMQQVHEIHSDMVRLIKEGRNTRKDDAGSSLDQIMEIMNRITAIENVEVGGDIWCHAMLMFRDPANRDIFLKMPSDDARLAWLKFAHTRNTI